MNSFLMRPNLQFGVSRLFNNRSSMAAPFIGGLVSGASSLLGSLMSSNNQKSVLAAQQRENALNRKFNAEQQRLANQFNLDMFNRTNEYNDPSAIVSRFQKAGLHPALAFGGFANAQSISSATPASSHGSVNPPSLDTSGISSAGSLATKAYQDAKLNEAQVDLIKSEAAKNKAELPWIDRLHTVTESLGLEDISNKIEERGLTQAKKNEILKNLEFIDQKIEESNQNIQESNARIKELFASATLKDEQANQLREMLQYQIKESIARCFNIDADTRNKNADSGLKEYDLSLKHDLLVRYGLQELSEQQYRLINQELDNLGQELRHFLGNETGDHINNFLRGVADLIGRVFH